MLSLTRPAMLASTSAPRAEDRLDAEDLRSHRSVLDDVQAARVRRDHPPDGGGVARRQVDPEREPVGSYVGLE